MYLRLGSNCTTLLVQHIVNFSLIKHEQRDGRMKQKCCTNNAAQFDPRFKIKKIEGRRLDQTVEV